MGCIHILPDDADRAEDKTFSELTFYALLSMIQEDNMNIVVKLFNAAYTIKYSCNQRSKVKNTGANTGFSVRNKCKEDLNKTQFGYRNALGPESKYLL